MGKQIIVGIILLGIGAGAGFGIQYMRSQAMQIESQTQIEELKAEKQNLENASAEKLKNAGKQLNDAKTQARKSQDVAIRLSKENTSYKLKIERLEAQITRAGGNGVGSVSTAPATSSVRTVTRPASATRPTVPRTTTTRPAATSPRPAVTSGGTREYTVQDGDNLWKIAESELDNGMRYKEIIELNPPITEKSVLTIGQKIKLPAK